MADYTRLRRAVADLRDALDEQKVEVASWRRNMKDLEFEVIDLKASLIQYGDTLSGVGGQVGRLRTACHRTVETLR